MADIIEELREGDVYRWQYRGPNVDTRQYGSYHCCSCIAIVANGKLRDTYWKIGNSFSDCRTFGLDDLPRLRLTRLANLEDLEKVREYQADYYDDADIVNLNHSNSPSGNFYLRKGATRSQKKMLEVVQRNLAQAQADERNAVRRCKELSDMMAQIESGDTSVHIIK